MKKAGGMSLEEQEMRRILNLDVKGWPDPETSEIFCFERMRAEAFAKGERLFPVQVAAVSEYEDLGAGLYRIPVGFGKTGICMMIMQAAWNAGVRKMIWLVPPQLVSGLPKRHIPEWRARVPLSLNFHYVAGRSRGSRQTLCESGAPGVYIFPYSYLSVEDTNEMLDQINPELIVCDEVHNLKNPQSARTKRLLPYLRDRQFVGMTGTLTSKGLSQYQHLASAALGDYSPVPNSASVSFRWGEILDPGEERGVDPTLIGMMRPLINWARREFPEEKEFLTESVAGARAAFGLRFKSAPGVVAAVGVFGASLRIENLEVDKCNDQLVEMVTTLEDLYRTPQGEDLDHAIHAYKWKSELSMGFYNSLVWPTPEEYAAYRESVSEDQAAEILERACEHLRLLSEHRIAMREFFKSSPPGLDTPREVGKSMHHYGAKFVPEEVYESWLAVKEADFEGRPDRKRIPVRVCDYKIRAALKWAKRARHGIIWYKSREVGRWLMEVLGSAGLDPVHCPAGKEELIESIGDPAQGGKGDRLVIASIRAHGTGRNLVAFGNQLFAQWPRCPVMTEQSLGRLHRNGQTRDEVIATTMISSFFDHADRAATLNDAISLHQSGTPQKVILADYDPMPKIYSQSFLTEQGFRPKVLERSAREMLAQSFGGYEK